VPVGAERNKAGSGASSPNLALDTEYDLGRLVAFAIQTNGLTKHFGATQAVSDLDLEVRAGEVFGYLGPNGAGKTTAIRLLLDFIRPTRGNAVVLGGGGADPEVRRRIGYLPGEFRLDSRYTARDVVDFFGKLRGTIDEAYASELIRRFDVEAHRPFGELSTGNKRKLAIIQAFMHRPELLILDEPTSGLDPLLQHEFRALVQEVSAGGVTVFLSSHSLSEVEALAARVGIVRKGRLVKVAEVEELRETARQRIEFHVGEGARPGVFEGLPGVVSVAARNGVITVVVEGSVDAVIKAAATMTVHRIETPGDELEEVFLGLYEGDER
jgi:beta-exotoxin I transport system ATP-binding protein